MRPPNLYNFVPFPAPDNVNFASVERSTHAYWLLHYEVANRPNIGRLSCISVCYQADLEIQHPLMTEDGRVTWCRSTYWHSVTVEWAASSTRNRQSPMPSRPGTPRWCRQQAAMVVTENSGTRLECLRRSDMHPSALASSIASSLSAHCETSSRTEWPDRRTLLALPLSAPPQSRHLWSLSVTGWSIL